MISSARWFDLLVVLGYMAGLVMIGLRFARRQVSTETYFVGKRSVPTWAMGLSLLATLISSVTFVAYPGSSYQGNWSLLVPGLMLLPVLAVAGSVIIPFYRRVVGMTAYEYFEKRFGRSVRIYSALMFSLAHFSKMGFVLYLMGLTITSMTGWNVDYVIVTVCAVMIFYTMIGGIEAVIWTDVIQAFVCWAGILACLGFLLFLPPGGPVSVFQIAAANQKFDLGSLRLDFSSNTIPVLIIYGVFWYLQRYTADQTVVQRFLVAKSDRAALKGIAIGATLCVPVWALFMLVGTCTWAFYRLTGEALPANITKADQVFPHFIATHLPPGVAGLLVAALVGAAMTLLGSDLNCLSAVVVEDFYRAWRPTTNDRKRLRVAKWVVAVAGTLSAVSGIILAHTTGSALAMWFAVSAMVSGGLAGLFLLAFFSKRANGRGVWVGIGASLVLTTWAVLTKKDGRMIDLGRFNFGWHELMIGAVANVALLAIGYAASWLIPAKRNSEGQGN